MIENNTDELIAHIQRLSEMVCNAQKKNKKLKLTKHEQKQVELIAASGLFDADWYLKNNKDVLLTPSACAAPIAHFVKKGALEGRSPNKYFHPHWYLDSYPDVVQKGVNPLVHFIKHGAKELRNPGPEFNTEYYLENNPDLAGVKDNLLHHFITFGETEGRKSQP
ncbi:hypothetical protein [Oceanimonas smirnovii]|uniref:hypothetical protein n=1 Tax=Oceanimonas smirnovii TaxID=264574 RepID=UPI00036AA1A5|nr:hypothetical protein [Oceanimonas smirnovii]